ncbi:cyclic nucleotide-binding domain-containing protein [Candidatus Woesearchaeota archaeon]|nr:cyclic nucleotide-binding domain-containing protein [Candidatus Woesearchaeota archaeon]
MTNNTKDKDTPEDKVSLGIKEVFDDINQNQIQVNNRELSDIIKQARVTGSRRDSADSDVDMYLVIDKAYFDSLYNIFKREDEVKLNLYELAEMSELDVENLNRIVCSDFSFSNCDFESVKPLLQAVRALIGNYDQHKNEPEIEIYITSDLKDIEKDIMLFRNPGRTNPVKFVSEELEETVGHIGMRRFYAIATSIVLYGEDDTEDLLADYSITKDHVIDWTRMNFKKYTKERRKFLDKSTDNNQKQSYLNALSKSLIRTCIGMFTYHVLMKEGSEKFNVGNSKLMKLLETTRTDKLPDKVFVELLKDYHEEKNENSIFHDDLIEYLENALALREGETIRELHDFIHDTPYLIYDVVQKHPISPSLSRACLNLASSDFFRLHNASPLYFNKGDVLCSQGQASDGCIYWIEEGKVRITRSASDGSIDYSEDRSNSVVNEWTPLLKYYSQKHPDTQIPGLVRTAEVKSLGHEEDKTINPTLVYKLNIDTLLDQINEGFFKRVFDKEKKFLDWRDNEDLQTWSFLVSLLDPFKKLVKGTAALDPVPGSTVYDSAPHLKLISAFAQGFEDEFNKELKQGLESLTEKENTGIKKKNIQNNNILFRKEDSAESVYFFPNGSLEVYLSKTGKDHTIAQYNDVSDFIIGETLFPELADSQQEGKKRAASVKATKTCSAIEITKQGLEYLRLNHAPLYRMITFATLANRFEFTRQNFLKNESYEG